MLRSRCRGVVRRGSVVVAAACALAVGAVAAPVRAAVSEMVVFGDSLSDTGNFFALTGGFPPPPYFDGRASNGPLWVEHLAGELGVAAPTPSLTGGSNYAYFGAQTGPGDSPALGAPLPGPPLVPNVGKQVDEYLGGHTPGGDELFVLWGGANDFLLFGQMDPSVPVANLSASISDLAAAGATQFLVANMPPLGQTPVADLLFPPGADVLLDAASVAFNGLLAAELAALESGLGVDIVLFDAFDLFQQALSDPAAFGFTNVTDPFLPPVPTALTTNPDEHLFWDIVHPTAVFHQALGSGAAQSLHVPEPVTAGLGLLGLVALAGATRRRRVG